MADRNETDALFATKRKKQQEEQAEQERREEMIRKKAEMEAEIRRLEEEAKRQKEQQEEARRQAEEEARRVQEEIREAEARAARMEEMAKQVQTNQVQTNQVQTKQEEAQVWQPAQIAEIAKKVRVQLGTCVQLGKIKVPLLYLVIGVLGVIVAVIILAVVLAGRSSEGDVIPEDIALTGEEVYGTDFYQIASAEILDYFIYYPDSFEEGYLEGGALFTHGRAEDDDFSYVNIIGADMDTVLQKIGSTDPADLVRFFEANTLGGEGETVYTTITDSGRTAYSSSYHPRNISNDFTDISEDVWANTAVMVLETVDGDGYLIALYGTVSDAYLLALDETAARFLDNMF